MSRLAVLRPFEPAAPPAGARRVWFRFGLSGLRWGDDGPVVLVLHGEGATAAQFAPLAPPLLASGRQVLALSRGLPAERAVLVAPPLDARPLVANLRLPALVVHDRADARVIARFLAPPALPWAANG